MADITNPTANEFDVSIWGIPSMTWTAHPHEIKSPGREIIKDYSKTSDIVEYVTKQYNNANTAQPSIKPLSWM